MTIYKTLMHENTRSVNRKETQLLGLQFQSSQNVDSSDFTRIFSCESGLPQEGKILIKTHKPSVRTL